MNQKEEGFLGGFLVLGFAIFIIGFLAGVITAFMAVSVGPATLEVIIFVFGFMIGMVVAFAILRVIRSRELARRSRKQVSSPFIR